MITPPPRPEARWKRPYWHASDEQATLLYFVFGRFHGDAATPVLPDGIRSTRHAHAALRDWDGYPLAGSLGEVLAADAPHAFEAARDTPDVLRIAGTLRDPASLDYLRDTLEAIARSFDAGAVAVVDPQVSGLYDRAAFMHRLATGNGSSLRQHFLVLCDADPDDPDRQWVHTRGLRKFARPDISLTRVPAGETDRAGALCRQLADMQALGGRFAEGQPLPVDEVGVFRAHHAGSPGDPRFFNTHVELRWPA